MAAEIELEGFLQEREMLSTGTRRAFVWFCKRTTGADEEGQSLAEYSLILALVAVATVGALQGLGVAIAGSPGFTTLAGAL